MRSRGEQMALFPKGAGLSSSSLRGWRRRASRVLSCSAIPAIDGFQVWRFRVAGAISYAGVCVSLAEAVLREGGRRAAGLLRCCAVLAPDGGEVWGVRGA